MPTYEQPYKQFKTCCRRPHSFILSSIHFDNEFELQTESAVERKKRKGKRRKGWWWGRGCFLFLLLADSLTSWPCAGPDRPPFPSPFNPSHSQLQVQFFLRYVTTGIWLGGGGVTTPAFALFDLPFFFFFFYLAFQHWWSINRLWPLMPGLSFESMWALVSGGGCTAWYSRYLLKQRCWLVTI